MKNPAKFMREVRQEAGRVSWPTRRETMISTIMVVVMVIIAALFFLVVDNVISWAIKLIIGIGG
jgi:preprotein translocase subunit SecE